MDIDYKAFKVPNRANIELRSMRTKESQSLSKKEAKKIHSRNLKKLVSLQARLFAEKKQSLLLVIQAMDTGGKDSTIRKIVGVVNPQGCRVTGFKAPSAEELGHDFLWRIHDHVPPKGYIGIFNRSHYEDVLIVRVHGLASSELIENRYHHINEFERLLDDHGVTIIKVMLHISKDYQLERLRERLIDPEKHWKFNPGDLEERKSWDDYMHAYEIMLNRCSTDHAPWYVIPAEKRWFRDAVVSQLVVETLQRMDPQYPKPDYDPADYPPNSIR